MNHIHSNQIIRYALFLITGLFLGWVFFHTSHREEEGHIHSSDEAGSEIWTCSMHPQIRMDKPGKCPICAMDLIPVSKSGDATIDPSSIHFTKEAAQLANVLTSVVSKEKPVKELRLYGKVQADERLMQSQVAYFPGRIEKLMVNFTGETVRKGQPLALIYSPDLVTAQQELLEAAKTKQAQPEIYEAARERLHQWKLSDGQIAAIENSGQVKANMEISSTANGIVTSRRVNNGDYISQGTVLYEVSDLSRVWVLFDAYESDLPYLQKGDKLDFTVQALPGTSYSATINFIDPVIDPVNRVAKVRVEVNNPAGKLKPEMFVTGTVKSNLDEYGDKLVIPRSAVLWTGKRSIVYVKQPGNDPVFKLREIELGPVLGNSYVVLGGLNDGEVIVTQGAFSVDAAAQLEGKPSMMNREENSAPAGIHEMGGHPEGKADEIQTGKSNQAPASDLQHLTMKVAGNCEMCKERIESAAKSVTGVVGAQWGITDKMLHVEIVNGKTDANAVQKAVANAGHDTEKFKAPADVYNKLPECCLYR